VATTTPGVDGVETTVGTTTANEERFEVVNEQTPLVMVQVVSCVQETPPFSL
jgi:hypothetical protein